MGGSVRRPCGLIGILILGIVFALPKTAETATSCVSALSGTEQLLFEGFFSPVYQRNLTLIGTPVGPDNMFKRLSAAEVKRLSNATPTVSRQAKLSAQNATRLRNWLNAKAGASVPGWTSTAFGVMVSSSWVGVLADVCVDLYNSSGDAGRIQLANLAGTVTSGGIVGLTEQVAKDSLGRQKYVWSHLYQASLNNRIITTPLSMCWADVAP